MRSNPSNGPTVLSGWRLVDRIDRAWAAAILFANGWNFALPVQGPIPFFFQPIQVARGIFIHEVLLAAYLLFFVFVRGGLFPVPRGKARMVAALIAAIGFVGLLSAVVNFRPVKDLVSAGRYFLLAAYFILAVYWANRYRPQFVLRTYLLAVLAGAAVNLYFTFTVFVNQLGGLPLLLGQSGPGGYLGICVVLSAWLMLIRRTFPDLAVAIATAVAGLLAVSISFSKLSMIMASCGAIAWCFVLWQDFNSRHARRWYIAIATVLLLVGVAKRDIVFHYLQGVDRFIEFKFRQIDPMSIATRSQYFVITGEILLHHPVIGAGLGGFYDAAIKTEAYKSSRAVTEDAELGSEGQSHPESSFLYYGAGTGVLGLIIVGILFVVGLEIFRRHFWNRRFAGKALWAMLAVAYFVFGMTLPTLYNSSIFYIPLAVAVTTGWLPGSLRKTRGARIRLRTVRMIPKHVTA